MAGHRPLKQASASTVRRRFVALSAVFIFVISACTSAPSPTPGPTGPAATAEPSATAAPGLTGRAATLVIAKNMASDLTMDPARAYEELYLLVNGNVYNRLTMFPVGPDGASFDNVVGDLAESWEVNDDATIFTFTLKPGIFFHSGNPVRAEDVRWSLQRFINIAAAPSFLLANVESVAAPDDRSVVITMKAPDPGFPKALPGPNFSILDSELVKQNGGTDAADAATTDTAEKFLTSQSAGSGPFKMVSYDPGIKLTLERADPFWGGPLAAFERVIFQHIPEPAAQADALRRGDVDVTWTLLPDVSQGLVADGYQLAEGPTIFWYYLSMSADPANNEALAREKVQLALKYATDWDGLARVCPSGSTRMYGLAPESVGGLPAGDPAVINEDLDLARQLLTEAGYADGFDMTLSTFKYTGFCPLWEDLVLKLAQDWSRVGVRVATSVEDFDGWITGVRAGEFDAIVVDWLADYPDLTNYALQQLPGGTIANRGRWGQGEIGGVTFKPDPDRFPTLPQIMDLTEQLRSETDVDAREGLVRELEPLFLRAGQNIPLLLVDNRYSGAPDLTAFNFHALIRFDLYLMGRRQ